MAQRAISQGPLSLLVEFEDRVDSHHASRLTVIGFVMAILGLIWLVTLIFSLVLNPTGGINSGFFYVVTYAGPILSFITYSTARRGLLGWAAFAFIAQLTLLSVTLVGGSLHVSNVILFTIPIAAAGGLLRRTGLVLTTMLVFVVLVIYAIGQRQSLETVAIDPSQTVLNDLFVVALALIIDAVLLYIFAGWGPMVAADAQRDVLSLQRVAAFGASLDIDDENRLMGQALNFTRTELKFSFAQIYLAGVSGYLDERVRVIPGGQNRIERGTFTGLPEVSVVRESATVRRTLRVTRADSYLRRTHFLPTTLCGAVLPLVYNDNLLGVMDVQHEAIDYIPDYQLLTLQTLADNLAATLVTVRQSLALKTTVRQQEETAQALRARLQELTYGSRRTAQRGGQRIAGYDLGADGQLIPSADMPDALRATLESSELQVITEGEQRIIRLPISLRDEQLGVMSFTLPSDKPLTERQIEMARIVANRLALALENKRLAEQTRAQIERERIASDVSSRLISATDVDSVLSVAVENFREVLGAINSQITVQPFTPPTLDKPSGAEQTGHVQPEPVEEQA